MSRRDLKAAAGQLADAPAQQQQRALLCDDRVPRPQGQSASRFPKTALLTIDRNFGGWQRAQASHFNDGGLFDQIFRYVKR